MRHNIRQIIRDLIKFEMTKLGSTQLTHCEPSWSVFFCSSFFLHFKIIISSFDVPLSLSHADDLMWDAWLIIDKETDINNSSSEQQHQCSMLIKSDKWIFVFVASLLLLFSSSLFCHFAISLDFYVLFMTLAREHRTTSHRSMHSNTCAKWSLESGMSFRWVFFPPLQNQSALECVYSRIASVVYCVEA